MYVGLCARVRERVFVCARAPSYACAVRLRARARARAHAALIASRHDGSVGRQALRMRVVALGCAALGARAVEREEQVQDVVRRLIVVPYVRARV